MAHSHEHHHEHEHHHHEHEHEHHEHGCGCEHCHHDEEHELSLGGLITGIIFFIIGMAVEHLPLGSWFPALDAVKLPGVRLEFLEALSLFCFFVAYIICGKGIIIEAISGIFHGDFLDENFLMSVSSIGAMFVGEFSEATVIMILYQIGEKFEDFAVEKSRNSIGEIAKLRPDTALVLKNPEIISNDPNVIATGKGDFEATPAEEVQIGSIILVKAGDRIPIDGIVLSEGSYVDTSALTGESTPKHVCAGHEVLSGSINKQGVLIIKTTKMAGDSALSRILNLVENATENKTKSEQFVTRFARIYTPIVCGLALAVGVLPPLFTKLFMPGAFAEFGWHTWIYRALEFLVVSCPCALVISIPLSFCGGITACAKNGILVKGSTFLEALGKTKTAVFDKTGTLTKGNFIVTDIHTMNPKISKQELIAIATHAELLSTHPISASLRAVHHENCCDQVKLEQVEDITSEGIKAVVNGKNVLAGNSKLMEHFNIECPDCSEHQGGTIVHVACDGVYAGHIVINDEIKDDSATTIEQLKKIGVENVVMLTGDNEKAAHTVAQRLGVHKVYGQMMSADKLSKVEELMKELEIEPAKDGKPAKRRGTLIFTGDGINDAPVLARADAGIAMGAMGSDAAVEAGDIIIMEDKPSKIVDGIKTARRTLHIVNENIYGSIGTKCIIMLLSALGITNMWLAIFGDVGVLILCVLNSMRTLKKVTSN